MPAQNPSDRLVVLDAEDLRNIVDAILTISDVVAYNARPGSTYPASDRITMIGTAQAMLHHFAAKHDL